MICMYNCIHSKNTIIWPSPMTPQSTRRSSNRRIHSPSSYSPKTRWLWHYTNNNPYTTNYLTPLLPLHHPINMRNNHNKFNLPTSNRPKIPNRLLLSKPYRPSNYCSPYTITTKLHRSNSPNNRPRTNLLYTILPSQYKLRTNS